MSDDFDPAYLVTLDEIYHCYWTARKRRRTALLREAIAHFWPDGHPARFVHLSGTNGKGSVAYYLEQGLAFAGSTGSWTGPHLFDYAERFHINAEPVPRADIVDVYRGVVEPYQRSRGDDPLGFPEIGILIALHLFEREQVLWGMMESGVGGRYTPLMALPTAACVVTNVGDDHPVTLGDEIWQRALEKAGIARPGVPFFTAARGEALGYVVKTAESEGAPVHVVGREDLETTARRVAGECKPDDPEISNLALALKLVRHFYPDQPPERVLSAMRSRLAGRFWSPARGVIVDVAHNRQKIEHFAKRLQIEYPGVRFRFLIGLTRRRQPLEIFRPLFPLAEEIIVTSASYPGRDPQEVAECLRKEFDRISVVHDPHAAYLAERDRVGEGRMLALTGSAYMIDQALNPDPYVRHTNASFGWRGRISDRT